MGHGPFGFSRNLILLLPLSLGLGRSRRLSVNEREDGVSFEDTSKLDDDDDEKHP